MDGLTNIIAKIYEQNDAECAEIIAKAYEKENEILSKARLEAESEKARIKAESDKKIYLASSKAESGAELEYKRAVLSKKSELITSCIEKALKSISESDDKVYFGYIEKLALSNALSGVGSIVFSKDDVARLPKGFVEELNTKLCDGKKLVLSDKTIDDGGFVIEYDEMKVDCTFGTLVEDNIDDIRDSLSKILFA